MAVDFSTLLYSPCEQFFGRDVTITPVVSAPAASAYVARGIFSTRNVMVATDAGLVELSDQESILDIRDLEFITAGIALPVQGDLINIPAEGDIPAEGNFEVTDTSRNGGGETTLVIRKWESAAP
jgi:hypothetical protein